MSSWFYKLRRKRCAANTVTTTMAASHKPPPPPPPSHRTPVPPPCSPNRASYYVPSRDRALSPRLAKQGNPKLRDTRFRRSPQPGDIVLDVAASRDGLFSGEDEPKLRPILTRPANSAVDDSDTASPTARVRQQHRFYTTAPSGRRLLTGTCRRRRSTRGNSIRLRWLHESVALVKESADPEEDFLTSMQEMIAANDDVRSPRSMEELLACYLALNAAEHHRAIVAAFRRAWLEFDRVCVADAAEGTVPFALHARYG